MRIDKVARAGAIVVWLVGTGSLGCGSNSPGAEQDTDSAGSTSSAGQSSTATGSPSTESSASSTSGAGGSATTGGATNTSATGMGGGGTETTTGTAGTSGSAGSGGTSSDDNPTFVYVGSGDFGSEPGMVSVYSLDRATKTLTPIADYPAGGLASFLAIDSERGRLYATDESGGGVISFAIDKATGTLTSLGATSSSNQPVYLSVTGDGGYLLAANYNQGSVDVYPIGSDGRAEESLGATQTGDQAHCVVIDAQNRVFVTNKGSSTIAHFSFASGTLTPTATPTTYFSSARHLFLHDDTAYVISEEMDLLSAFSITDAGTLSLLWERTRLQNGNGTGADIQVTPSGKYLYATNRDPDNTIVAYDISGDDPVLLGHESTLGDTPRNFAIDPSEEVLIVANHGNDKSLTVFSIQADGSLEPEEPLGTSFSPFFVGIVQF